MSDFPLLPPPAGGLHDAMAAAGGRRMRMASTTSSIGVAVLCTAALLAGSNGQQSLIQEPVPQPPAVTGVDKQPAGPHEASRTSTSAAGRAAASSLRAAARRATGATPGRAAQGALPLPASARSQVVPGRPPVTGPMLSEAGGPSTIDSCPVERSSTGRPVLCLNVYANDSYDSEGQVTATTLAASLCSFDTRTMDVHFPSTRELDFAVLDTQGHEMWRWSSEHVALAHVHVLTLSTWDCWQWTTPWRLVDGRGARLPKGSYAIVATSSAEELGRDANAFMGYYVS